MNEVTIGIDAGVAVVLVLAGALADRRRIRQGPVPGGPTVDVVPHTGPPPEVTLQDGVDQDEVSPDGTGQGGAALGIRLAPESGLIRITTEPVPR
jgi:hypothetical protein